MDTMMCAWLPLVWPGLLVGPSLLKYLSKYLDARYTDRYMTGLYHQLARHAVGQESSSGPLVDEW